MSEPGVRRDEVRLSSRCKAHPSTAQAGSSRSSQTNWLKPTECVFELVTAVGVQAVTQVNADQVQRTNWKPRQGQAGRHGVAERFVVLPKPGNASGGKDLSSRQAQYVVQDLEIGQPISSTMSSGTAKRIACQNKGVRAFYEKAESNGLCTSGDF